MVNKRLSKTEMCQVEVKKGLRIAPSSQKVKKRSQVEITKVKVKKRLTRSGT